MNRSQNDEFKMERGFLQGDSFSPFLFLISVEGLYVLMNVEVEKGMYTGYGVGAQNIVIIFYTFS